MAEALLAARDVHKRFGDAEVLRGVTVSLRPGEIVAVLGPSGCGKTTLLRSLVLLECPDRGEIVFEGTPIAIATRRDGTRTASGDPRVRSLRHRCGVAFQGNDLWSQMTVLQNVIEVPMAVNRLSKRDAIARAMPLLSRLGIEELRDRHPLRLSGGQQQRAAIARAMVMEPDLLLFDEPTSALDPQWTARVGALLEERAAAGCAVMMVTHDVDFARSIATSVTFLDRGRVLDEGPPASLLGAPYRGAIARFLASIAEEVPA